MYYSKEVIRYLQSNNILALKFDHALTGVGNAVSNHLETIGAGARRALYYTSCFTDEYNDVCQQQKTEDIRFIKGVFKIIRHEDVVFKMLQIYFEKIFSQKTSDQIEHIKQMLMAVNIHIASSSLAGHGFALAVATSVAVSLNLNLNMSTLAGRTAHTAVMGVGLYGIVQNAADSAYRLHIAYPAYYSALYAQEIEMMYFLVEPLFERADALKRSTSDSNVANIISRMIQ